MPTSTVTVPIPDTGIYNKVLNQLPTSGLKAVFRQHTHLMKFEDGVAHIAIHTPSLAKLLRAKSPQLALAFYSLLQRSVDLKFYIVPGEK